MPTKRILSAVDSFPPLRYNGSVKWARRIILGVVALFVLFVVVNLVIFNWPASGGTRMIQIDDEQGPMPTGCEASTPTPSPPWYYLACLSADSN